MEKLYILLVIMFIICYSNISFAQNKLSPGDHFADINGIVIHYYVSGAGPVCLFPTPGWGPSLTIYKNSLYPLEKYFTMVYYDTRISGQSTGPDDPTKYTNDDFMNDMDALRVYLEQPKVWLMGHSDGGYQVLYYGIHNNDKLNGIIAIDARAGMDKIYKEGFKRMVDKHKDEPIFEKAFNMFFGLDTTRYSISEFVEITLPVFFHDTTKIKDFKKLGDPQLSNKASKYTIASKFRNVLLFPELHKITVPVLVVVGDDDVVTDKISQSDRIHNNIQGSDEIVIKDAGHFSWVEQPEQFFKDVSEWLEKQGLKAQE